MHLARDAPPFVLLREDHPAEELRAGPLAALALARLLCLLALGEVEVRADDAHDRSAGFAAYGKSAREHVDVVAVLVPQPELQLVRPVAVGVVVVHARGALEVVGMNQAFERADVRLDLVFLVAEHPLPVRGIHHRARLQVPVVDAFLRARKRQPQPLLALAQRGLGALALRQVEMRADDANHRPAGFAPDRQAA